MKRINKIIIGVTLGFLCAGTAVGQKAVRERVHEGNKYYKKEHFTEAEIAYRKSLEVNSRSFEGIYDLGNALYKQQKFPEAAEQYKLVAAQSERFLSESPANINRLAQVFHNLGNIGMQAKDYANSIQAYKQSLRLNPRDDETRYNLALAQKLLENQPQEDQEQEQQQDQDQPDDQDQDQNQPPPQDDRENKTQEEEQPDEKMSPDNAQQILDAFLQDEKDVQDKVRQIQEQQRERRRTERQW
jgi:tetratricopeptide (TPR) repeat protein